MRTYSLDRRVRAIVQNIPGSRPSLTISAVYQYIPSRNVHSYSVYYFPEQATGPWRQEELGEKGLKSYSLGINKYNQLSINLI